MEKANNLESNFTGNTSPITMLASLANTLLKLFNALHKVTVEFTALINYGKRHPTYGRPPFPRTRLQRHPSNPLFQKDLIPRGYVATHIYYIGFNSSFI